ncbi:MAG TPA: hypothetical protein VMV93_04445 [Chloroflexota bacterium]|nr:hypothetical protein [Chloroflexota bacterium]
MQCAELNELLLLPDAARMEGARQHAAGCPECAAALRSATGFDTLLRASVVLPPPAALQAELHRLALDAARPASRWQALRGKASQLWPASDAWVVQGLVVFLLAAAAWQLWNWLGPLAALGSNALLGLQLVLASPAAAYLPRLQASAVLPPVLLSFVALAAWLLLNSPRPLPTRSRPPLRP